MKIQSLAIIFIIIILPIAIVIGEYASTQIEVFRLEQLYNSRLITATDDALEAFQINTFNDAASDIADSKITSIEASVNAFYNSMESSFGLNGYSKEELLTYVPALVYTMYDGYYIYSAYSNVADTSGGKGLEIKLDSNDIRYGFKPYVYYSCRYVNGNTDVVINYSLDNYITVQGIVNGTSEYRSGYLVTIDTDNGLRKTKGADGKVIYSYDGVEILSESSLSDNLVEQDLTTKPYKYIKLNGTKYYWDEENENIFYLLGKERIKQVTKIGDEALYTKYVNQIENNTSALNYYISAYEFSEWVYDNLGNLEPKHAQIADSESEVKNSGTGKIFVNADNSKTIPIEYPGSNFNLQRKEVIRYSIESNLSVAIANFNNYTNSEANFQMPKLSDTDWEIVENEVSIISFLQGLNIGGKLYNGYAVVSNSKTEEVVKEEKIYITTSDGYYHKINDKHFVEEEYESADISQGVLDLDFEIRKDGATGKSYIQKNGLGCYVSIVGQEKVDTTYDSIYEYLQSLDNSDKVIKKLKQTYYTALGRERCGTYKVENSSNIAKILDKMSENTENVKNDAGTSTGTGTDTGTGTGAGTDTGTDTETGTDTGTGTEKEPEVEIITEALTAADITAEDYGGEVTNYNASALKWEIFHSDGTNIYLIVNDYMPNRLTRNYRTALSISGYSGSVDITASNPAQKWLSKYKYTSTNDNMKATAYLLDTSVWSSLADSSYAEYAIGGPTLELFAASYNTTHPEKTLEINVANERGYQVRWSGDTSYTSTTLNGVDTLDGLYTVSNKNGALGMWIASPNAGVTVGLWGIGASGNLHQVGYNNMNYGARPIVCLKSEIKLEKQDDGTYLIVE